MKTTRRKYTKRPKIKRKYTKRTKIKKRTKGAKRTKIKKRNRVKYTKRPKSTKIKQVKRMLYQLKLGGGGLWDEVFSSGSHPHQRVIELSKQIHEGRFPCSGKGNQPCIYKGAGEGAGTKCNWCGKGIDEGKDIYVVPGITGSYIYHNNNCSKKSGGKHDDANIRVPQVWIEESPFMRTSEEVAPKR